MTTARNSTKYSRSYKDEDDAEYNRGSQHLKVQSRNLHGHQRNGSTYSRSISLLDIYCAESPSRATGDSPSANVGKLDDDEIDSNLAQSLDELQILSSNESVGASPVAAYDRSNSTLIGGNSYSERPSSIMYVKPTTASVEREVLNSNVDRYGFKKVSTLSKITAPQYDRWFKEYSDYSLRRKKKWEILMKSHGLGLKLGHPQTPASSVKSVEDIPTRFPPRSDKVKKMVRRGIPAEWRGNAWFFYAGGYERLSKHEGLYDQVVRDTANIKNKDTEVIERDLFRTFPDNIYFNASLSAGGGGSPSSSSSNNIPGATSSNEETLLIKCLRRLLVAFAHYQPQIGYCQSLNFLAGLLLLFMSEERAFWMLVILTERIIPKVHAANLEGVHTDQGVLMLCVKEYIPHLWGILGTTFEGEKLSEDKMLSRLPPLTLVTSSWFMSVFVGVFPIETTLRVWDILWYEGSKTIFRISLTIFQLCVDSPEFQSRRSHGTDESEQIELFQLMQNFPKNLLDPNLVVDHCFKKIGGYGFGSLSQDEIDRCRSFVSKQREKLNSNNRRKDLTEMTPEERNSLVISHVDDGNIHDVYGFHRPIMSGMLWNKSISNKVKKKFQAKKKD
ncbi:uncharacterized protein LODBEIA_P56630 [Lodderomyces beijingensis]|uniref:Oxidant-induced cell-cycle arrest protein 5 n=1 Tax=Lodderomyces beijingensis TaxID=1775926 RepID=A0ABP0ZTH1_9ASCO